MKILFAIVMPPLMLLVSLLLAASSNAGQPPEHGMTMDRLTIAIDDGSDDVVLIDLDGNDSTVAMHDMQLGETRSVVDAQGRNVLLTRTEDGIEVNVDGKIIEVPAFDTVPHGAMTATLTTHDVDDIVDIDIDVAEAVHIETVVGDHGGDAVTIMSGSAIDEATRDSIRAILSSSGHTGDVVFVDREAHQGDAGTAHAVHEARRIKIISREVSATN